MSLRPTVIAMILMTLALVLTLGNSIAGGTDGGEGTTSADSTAVKEAHEGPDPLDEIPSLRVPSPAWEDSTPVARVGEEEITAGDLFYALDRGEDIDRSVPPDSLRRTLLEKVINQKLLAQEAYRQRLDRTSGVANDVQRIEDKLALEELRRRIHLGKVDVTEAKIRELYERYYYTLRVHYISVDRRDFAEGLLRRIKAGEDFEDLARRYSEHKSTAEKGGDLGEFTGGYLLIQFEDEVFKLKPGQLTDVVKGRGEHYKIYRLDSMVRDRQPPMSLDEMRPALAHRVRTREAGNAYYAWQLSMFDKYHFKINEENFKAFMFQLRDKIASYEAINSTKRDSLAVSWVFSGWPSEELTKELVTFDGGRLIVGEFHRAYRDKQVCPTCLWRDSDVQLRQFVRGLAFDKLVELEKRAIRAERLPALKTELKRRKDDRMAQYYLTSMTASNNQVGEDEARAFWEEHKEEYKKPSKVKVRRILVETEEQARDIVKRLEGGADFAALAERFSKDETTNWRGGETDFFGAGALYGVGDVAVKHEVGELIPPFKSRKGWEVILILDKTPAGLMTFDEVREMVKSRVATINAGEKTQEILDNLRRATVIQIDEGNLARVALTS